MKKEILLLLMCLLSVSVFAQKSIDTVIGNKAWKILTEAESVWAYELLPIARPNDDQLLLAGVVVKERIGIMNPEDYSFLLKAMAKNDDFNWTGMENRIPFTPEAGFEFSRSGKILVVMVDFDADEIGVKYGQQLYRFEFDKELRAELLNWLKSTFEYQEGFLKID